MTQDTPTLDLADHRSRLIERARSALLQAPGCEPTRLTVVEAFDSLEAELSSLRKAYEALAKAAYIHTATHPVFRGRNVGDEGSRARLQQADQIATEDALFAAIKAASALSTKGEDHG